MPEESKSSEPQELHAVTAVAMVGLAGPKAELEAFVQEWVVIASNAALELVEISYPELQLIPLAEEDAEV